VLAQPAVLDAEAHDYPVLRGLCGFAGYVVGRGGAAVDGVGKPGAVGIIRAR
jgi:hypothetical protein